MSYVQIRYKGKALTRSLDLDPRGRVGGYPAYHAYWSNSLGSVLAILYHDDSGIYLTDDKIFRLTQIGDEMFFSSNLTLTPIIPADIQEVRWYSEWANQKNTFASFNSLVTPPSTVAETLGMLARLRIPISIYRDIPNNQGRNIPWADQGAWIGSVTPQRNLMADKGNYIHAFFRWWPAADNYSSAFYLVQSGDEWQLGTVESGTPDYQSMGFYATPVDNAHFVGDWGDSNASRWSYSQNYIMKISINHVGGYTYQFKRGDRRLSQAGSWNRNHLNGHPVHVDAGVEFYNDNDIGLMNVDIVVLDNSANAPGIFPLTDTMVYRLGPYVRAMRSRTDDIDFHSINPGNVPENMPRGMAVCELNPWTGSTLSCYTEEIPYTNPVGTAQCTTLEDFTNDPHCRQWAIANKGETMEERIRGLCSNATYDNPSICNCFLPETVYYNAIVNEQGVRTANAVRATNLLQCESGLCGQDGSISSRLYYYGDRRCDYCVQALDINLTGNNVTGNTIIPIQQCAQTDSTYTWPQLIAFLKNQGAYQLGVTNTGITYNDVILSPDNTLIFLNTSTTSGKTAFQQMSVLQYLPPTPLDNHALSQFPFLKNVSPSTYILVSEDIWKSNVSSYSSDIRAFMLIVRSLVQRSRTV